MYEAKSVSGKVVVVGDGACGKTCLLEVFKRNKFPEEYIPTVVDNFVKEVKIDNNTIAVSLTLWDTAGQEDYDSVRPLSYRDTDLVLLCYTVENSDLLDNIAKKWVLEIKNYCPTAGYFLIGLKKDLREEENNEVNKEKLVSEEMGRNIAEEINAVDFIECSARTGENVDLIFEKVAAHIYDKKKEETQQTKSCLSTLFCCGG
ncbi:RAS GTPase [Spraguea lophii 42_110]|uniref:RAS GTPase n=1 Tax=Spraguea lophii (strain 42_110) TaxID=1358809 RepID=S7XUF5_SPRLO|nr:RAS GTPase [Spraguea lophii 42_110]